MARTDINDKTDTENKGPIDFHREGVKIFKKAMFYMLYAMMAYILLSLYSYSPTAFKAGGASLGWIRFLYMILFTTGLCLIYYDNVLSYQISLGVLFIWILLLVSSYTGTEPSIYGAKGIYDIDYKLTESVSNVFIRIKSEAVKQVDGKEIFSTASDTFITTSIIIQIIGLTVISVVKRNFPTPLDDEEKAEAVIAEKAASDHHFDTSGLKKGGEDASHGVEGLFQDIWGAKDKAKGSGTSAGTARYVPNPAVTGGPVTNIYTGSGRVGTQSQPK